MIAATHPIEVLAPSETKRKVREPDEDQARRFIDGPPHIRHGQDTRDMGLNEITQTGYPLDSAEHNL